MWWRIFKLFHEHVSKKNSVTHKDEFVYRFLKEDNLDFAPSHLGLGWCSPLHNPNQTHPIHPMQRLNEFTGSPKLAGWKLMALPFHLSASAFCRTGFVGRGQCLCATLHCVLFGVAFFIFIYFLYFLDFCKTFFCFCFSGLFFLVQKTAKDFVKKITSLHDK